MGDSIGVSTVVARVAKTIASIPVGLSPKKNGPSLMSGSTARQSRSPASMMSSSEWRSTPCVQRMFLMRPRTMLATSGRAIVGTESKVARVGLERRISGRTVGGLARSDRIGVRLPPPLRYVDTVDPGAIEAEHLLLEHRRELRVAVRLSQHRVNLEAAEGLDLVLRVTIPDRVGAPEHIVLADVLQEFAQEVRGGGRIAHDKTPGRTELGVDVGVAADAVVLDRLDQGVDAARGVRGIIGSLSGTRLVARMVDDEVHVGVEAGRAADVGAASKFLGKAPEQQAFMDADVAHSELARPLDERDANVGTVERKAAAVRA